MAQDVQNWGCTSTATEVRLVRNLSSKARGRVLATNLAPVDFPWECFGELYHERWRTEVEYKRLKRPMHLESASGLSEQTLIVDVTAKVLAENLTPLRCTGAPP